MELPSVAKETSPLQENGTVPSPGGWKVHSIFPLSGLMAATVPSTDVAYKSRSSGAQTRPLLSLIGRKVVTHLLTGVSYNVVCAFAAPASATTASAAFVKPIILLR